jgi:type I restriction-modification system DNA methylase subunit
MSPFLRPAVAFQPLASLLAVFFVEEGLVLGEQDVSLNGEVETAVCPERREAVRWRIGPQESFRCGDSAVRAEHLQESTRRASESSATTPQDGHAFYNTSQLTLKQIVAEPAAAATNLREYVAAFSENAREVMERYEFDHRVRRLEHAGLLHQVISKFADLDLRPEAVSTYQMSLVFEELVRRFAEQSNETAGEHFTPRDVVRLMVTLLVEPRELVLRYALGLGGTVRVP